jgi:catechol 2,3-dioxygenase-like lactoylglutathione lyase family enzyme
MQNNPLIPELDCSDLDASLKFYVDLLGFTILYMRPEEKFAFLEREGAQLMIEQIGIGRNWLTGELTHPFGRGINFQIMVGDVVALCEKVRGGHPIFGELEEKWYDRNEESVGNLQFLVQDPDGYLLRFFQDLGSRPK